jgi:hypothetical protein
MRTITPVLQAFDPNVVTPGVIGFLAIFFVAVATTLLVLDMNRRVRRTRYRGELAERRARTESRDTPDE